ncbi:4'-phosphopantetheinyl transferase superfamily protein [Streptomyces sp. XD-27]|uniref:4'-phosphopantetheinyl transferase family protein n=1 Tax=Streptomyces sp. XD-27 TaxID=3062779 RepID=UPI0026F43B69|nr:4'-phosphopantetheinyl transferase superfamily protein [Streptomyces sp. XD-27]WKX70489.1 4'-phosphopantetheinyl transferase superfamily protein [Streptomyces sp. XD-27]
MPLNSVASAVSVAWGPASPLPAGPDELPGRGEVAVWLLEIPRSAAAAAAAGHLLDADEARRAARFRGDLHQQRYLTSHVGLRVLLGAYLGIGPAEVEFTRERCGMPDCDKPHGRPAVVGREGLHFSLSHAEDAALVAVAAAPVGADIEASQTRRGGVDLTGQLHPDERAAIAALPASLRDEAFLSCWVRKEAYLKGIGTGLPGGVGTHHVGLAEGLAPSGSRVPEGWALIDLEAPDGYHAAVALRTEDGSGAGRPVVTLDHLSL